MRVIRALVTLTAVWGALITLFLASGHIAELPARLRGGAPQAKPTGAKAGECDCDCAAKPSADHGGRAKAEPAGVENTAQPAAVPHEAALIEAARYTVCEREEGTPAFSRLELGREPNTDASALFAIHCGPSAHVIAVEAENDALSASRVLRMRAASHNPAESPHAAEIVAADVDGDGRVDLIVPVLFLERTGAPSGGALYLLKRRAEGSFDPASRLLDIAPGALAAATLDHQPGSDLALLHLHDTRTARAGELWLIRGGPAPLRSEKIDVGVGPNALAAADLDLDGLDDIAVVSEREGRVRLFLSSRAQKPAREALVLELPGVREVVAGDIDGDAHRDLVLAGERVWVVSAQKGAEPTALPVADSGLLRDVHVVDVNMDGKFDIVGYAHPNVVVLEHTAAGDFTRKTLATLRGDAGVLFARLAWLDRDPRADLVLTLVSAGPDAQIELGLARNLSFGAEVDLAKNPQPLHEASLPQQFMLP